jgi:hypothetical protein
VKNKDGVSTATYRIVGYGPGLKPSFQEYPSLLTLTTLQPVHAKLQVCNTSRTWLPAHTIRSLSSNGVPKPGKFEEHFAQINQFLDS